MQGFNMGKYVPPDAEGVHTGNQLNKKHPLGSRASKLASQGILTVVFELPFAVWCDTCQPRHPTIIGQGVRFNAAKKKVGNYYSTPIWSFTIKHAVCGGEIEIRTDPKMTRYVVVRGGRARDSPKDEDSLVKLGEGHHGGGSGFEIQTEKERQEQRDAAFGKLEKTIADRERAEEAKVRIDELLEAQEKAWEDPYARNQKLRKAFRVGRKEREREAERTEDLKERMGLGIELLPGTEEDERRAKLIEFGGVPDSLPFGRDDVVQKVLARPLFGGDEKGQKEENKGKKKDGYKGKLKSEIVATKMREALVSEIVGNTRAAKDPFLEWGSRESTLKPRGALIPGLKRKRAAGEETPGPPLAEAASLTSGSIAEGKDAGLRDKEETKSDEKSPSAAQTTAGGSTAQTSKPGLVAYNSDSD